MFTDIWTVAQKELKETFVQRGSLRSGIANLLIVMVIVGIFLPMQAGEAWVQGPLGLVSAAWLPMLMSMSVIVDYFAGERERHTLETLLASRLSDLTILLGKLTAATIYIVGISLAGLLLGAITVNIQTPGAGFYPMGMFLAAIGFSILGATLINSIGVLVSLKADGVRQAYQRMSLGMMLLLFLPIFLGPQVLPASVQAQIAATLRTINPIQFAIGVAVVLLIADALLISITRARFQRSRLISD